MESKSEFQSRASNEGRIAQEIAERVLVGAGFSIQTRNRRFQDIGVMINFVAVDATGEPWYFDTAGSFTSRRSGLLRTDTMWKTLGRANVLSGKGIRPLIFLTTNLPKVESCGDRALHSARASFFDAIEMTPATGKARLSRYATGKRRDRPLPGFFSAQEVYDSAITVETTLGPALSVPVALTGEGSIQTDYKVLKLPHRFTVYLPSRTRSNVIIPTKHRKDVSIQIQRILSKIGGGCTCQKAVGSWVDPVSGVVLEDVLVIETYSEAAFPVTDRAVIVELIMTELDQHTAAVILDGDMLQFRR